MCPLDYRGMHAGKPRTRLRVQYVLRACAMRTHVHMQCETHKSVRVNPSLHYRCTLYFALYHKLTRVFICYGVFIFVLPFITFCSVFMVPSAKRLKLDSMADENVIEVSNFSVYICPRLTVHTCVFCRCGYGLI